MPNNSSTGGYLIPSVLSPPLEDDALVAIFQKAIVGITGFSGQFVRPRWQATVPKQPESTVNWCSLGVKMQDADDGPAFIHDPSGNGVDTSIRHEQLTISVSFYGPLGQRYAVLLRDGMAIPQNNEALGLDDTVFVDATPILTLPELINQTWFKRYDLDLIFNRKTTRTYAIENLLTVDEILISDTLGPIT